MFADCSGGKKVRAQAKFAASSETIDVLSSIAGLIRVMQKLHPAVVVNLKKVEEVDHAHPWLRGEISIFQDIVGNLLDNACRFARHKVSVTISADHELCILIDDDGPGMPPEQRASVLRRGVAQLGNVGRGAHGAGQQCGPGSRVRAGACARHARRLG